MKRGLLFASLIATSCGSDDPLRSDVENPINPGGNDAAVVTADAGTSGPVDSGRPASMRDARSGNPDPDAPPPVCESFDIATGRVLPDMLIVLDRSGSMKMGNINRWDPSVRGITSITAKLDTQIRFGLMAFPGAAGNTDGSGERCAPGELEVPIDLKTSVPIADKLEGFELVDSTPTSTTLEAAHKVLKDIVAPPDQGAKGAPYVVLVTDGAPNCSVDEGSGSGPSGFDQTAFEESVAAIEAMAKDGIKTYVLGYDGKREEQLRVSLDAMAVAGDTGDTEHRAIENEAGLVTAFTEIAGKTVSCDFKLEKPPSDASYVLVKVGDKAIPYNDANGWILNADKTTLTLQGTACSDLNRVEGARVSVQVQCTIVQAI